MSDTKEAKEAKMSKKNEPSDNQISNQNISPDTSEQALPVQNAPEVRGKKEVNNELPAQPGYLTRSLKDFWKGLISRQIFQKVFTLLFALVVFSGVYLNMVGHRNVITYMGVMLLMVIVYAEILVIRDHLWVIEGSMREARRWRDIFFNQTNLRRQRLRKLVVVLFALGIFSFVYVKSIAKPSVNAPLLSYLGVILMITVLYYEILTIRDEVFIMMQALGKEKIESEDQDEDREKGYDKFIQTKESNDRDSGERQD